MEQARRGKQLIRVSKLEDPRTKVISFKVSEEEYLAFKAEASAKGALSVSGYVRAVLLSVVFGLDDELKKQETVK